MWLNLGLMTSHLKPRVLLVEDDEFQRALLVSALEREDFNVVLDTPTVSQAVKSAPGLNADAAVLDLELGRGPSGIDLALNLRRNQPTIGIVFLTNYKDLRLLSSDSSLAPYGTVYLEKSTINNFSKLAKSIEQAIVKGKNAHQKPDIDIRSLTRGTDLTNTQIEIVKLVAQGRSNQSIAEERKVSEKSIEQTLSRILKKAGIDVDERKNRRVELTLYYLRQIGVMADDIL